MPGLGELNRVVHRVLIANLADHDDVGRLTQRVLQRVVPVVGVDADLAMRHDAAAMRMHILDWIFDRDDVAAAVLVAVADHGRQRRRFTRAGAAHDEAQTALRHRHVFELRRQVEILERRNLRDDRADDRADVPLRDERAHAETADALRRDREVALLRRVELLGLLVVHDGTHDQGALRVRQRPIRERTNRAVDLDRRREVGRDEEVGTVVLDHLLEQVLRQSYCLIAFHSDALL